MPAVGFSPIPDDAIAVAPDDGGIPRVSIVNPATAGDIDTVQAYEDSFRGGVHVALGDVTGDGVRDLIIAPGAGGGPRIRIVDGKSGDTLADLFAFEPSFTGGLTVSTGDVNGDGKADIIVGTGAGGGPRVRVLDGATLGRTVLRDFFAYEDGFRGGVLVASGDVDGDGHDDIITGTGVGGGPRVVTFSGANGKTIGNFFAYEDGFRGGVLVASGDLDGDGRDDIITGTGPGGGPVVRAISGRDGHELNHFLADDSAFRSGVRVEANDVTHDGLDDIVTHTRHGNSDDVRLFDGRNGSGAGSFSRTVDDNPHREDHAAPPPTTPVNPVPTTKVEGTITAIDTAAGTVTIAPTGKSPVVVKVVAATKIERNGFHTTLSTFRIGDLGEAEIGSDGNAVKIEARSV